MIEPREGQRIAFKLPDGSKLYYDVDADGKVYWLKPRGNKLERRRVLDAELAATIQQAVLSLKEKPDDS